jgi:DNA primase
VKDRELFEHVDVETFLRELGIRKVRDTHNGEVEFSCPFPGHSGLDSNPSASMATVERPHPEGGTYPKTSFYCFTCGMKGSAITFLSEYEGCSPIVAKRHLVERFAPGWVDDDEDIVAKIKSILEPKEAVKPRVPVVLDEEVLDRFWINWPEVYMAWEGTGHTGVDEPFAYMLSRGFEPETLMYFGVGYDDLSHRITIPARNASGKLLGFKARAWWPDAKPRYKVLGGEGYGFEPYEVGRILWGLNIAIPPIREGQPMLIREGEINAMMLHQMGIDNAVGISGKILSRFQIALIKEHASSAIIWMDSLADSIEAASKLEFEMPVWIVPETERDPADSSHEEVEEALAEKASSIELRIVSQV